MARTLPSTDTYRAFVAYYSRIFAAFADDPAPRLSPASWSDVEMFRGSSQNPRGTPEKSPARLIIFLTRK